MGATTANKKEIVDFLWEWAESHGDWSKLLINKVVSTQYNLSTTDRTTVFNYFLQSLTLHTGLPALAIVKPTYTPTKKQIELVSLSNVTGVNRLAKNQTINFSKNLTLIYGENGTGKTGYGRILKALGFSYEYNKAIHTNIYGKPEPQSALIKYNANGADQTFNWAGNNSDAELGNISVFNSNCVQISLSDNRQLIVSPIGFHLFNLVTEELEELTKLLQAKIASHPTILSWVNVLNPETPQQIFISKLSGTSTEQKLNELSALSPTHEQDLKGKETELSNLNKALLQTEINNLNSQNSELDVLIAKIQVAQTSLTAANWQALIDCNKEISNLESKTQTGIKDIAEKNGIEFYETTEFKSFIAAAESYIKTLNKPEYPQEKDLCVYCKQPLAGTAKELLLSYRALLNDKTQENLEELKKKKANLIKQVSQVGTDLIFHQATFGLTEGQKPKQPSEILEFNKELGALKTTFITDNVASGSAFNFDYSKYSKFLTDKKALITTSLAQKTSDLTNIAAKETQLKKDIAELKDRQLLSTKIFEIKKAIANHKVVSLLNKNGSSFNSKSISTKTTQAREELVKQNFDHVFAEELKALRKSHIKVDLSFGTSKGSSQVLQKLNSYALTEILSEGEQKSIALAEFLTELQLDNIKAPVVFDDPVNSLDHNIIDDVARRLMKLSKDRQVVIFTHSVLLFNSMLYFSGQPSFTGLNCKFYNSSNDFGETGLITEAEEEINKTTSYIKKINLIFNNTPKDRKESDIAEDGYGFLRSAIELCVENEIFKGTVKRYQKNIALTSFVKVDGGLVNQYKDKLNEIFERCCGYIKGHSNPTEIHNAPTLTELKSDFDEFMKIRAVFI